MAAPLLYPTNTSMRWFEICTRSSYDGTGFGAYLSKPQTYEIDLSGATILKVIDTLCDFRQQRYPRIRMQYSCLVKQLKSVENAFGVTIMPNMINGAFYDHFVSYMYNVNKLAASTIKTNLSRLRFVLSWASRYKCEISPTFDDLCLPKYNQEQIALTPDEISHIYHFDISTISKRKQYRRTMERVKDMFVLCCNLGQRFGDMVRIDRSCFERNVFSMMQQKTGAKCRVDIDKLSIDSNTTYKILEKYNYRAPYDTDISSFNRYIKMLLKHIGQEFCEDVKRDTRVNGLVESKYYKKWQLVSSHTGRRSFATTNILRGHNEAEVRRATGHKTSAAFAKYLCYFDD